MALFPTPPRFTSENDVVRDGVVECHKSTNELAWFDAQSTRPDQIAVGRDSRPAVLNMRNQSVILGAQLLRQFALGKPAFLAMFLQPASGL